MNYYVGDFSIHATVFSLVSCIRCSRDACFLVFHILRSAKWRDIPVVCSTLDPVRFLFASLRNSDWYEDGVALENDSARASKSLPSFQVKSLRASSFKEHRPGIQLEADRTLK